MRLWSRLKRGWRVGATGVGVLRSEPRLMAFPVAAILVLSALGGLAVLAALQFPSGLVALADRGLSVTTATGLLAFFLASFVTTTVWTFFAAALVHCTAGVFRGGNPSVQDGLAAAWRARRKIVAWGLVAATVSVLFRLLEEWTSGRRLLRSVLGFTWTVLTFFVVPVIVLEDLGVRESVRESGRVFVETWGETASATVGATVVLVAGTLALTAALSVGFVLAAGSPTALGVLVVAAFVLFLLQVPAVLTVATAVKTALYLCARDDEVPAALADVDVAAAVE